MIVYIYAYTYLHAPTHTYVHVFILVQSAGLCFVLHSIPYYFHDKGTVPYGLVTVRKEILTKKFDKLNKSV